MVHSIILKATVVSAV